jgi:hypothetical protein
VPLVGNTLTDATGTWFTVTLAVPLCPSLLAVIVAVPAVTAVTIPVGLTVAMLVALEVQLMVRPVNTLPPASRVVAPSCAVPPGCKVTVVGLTVTVATGTAVTVKLEVPVRPSLVAVMVTDPGATPVTRPLELTVASPGLLEDQAIARPVSTFPPASLVVALSCRV